MKIKLIKYLTLVILGNIVERIRDFSPEQGVIYRFTQRVLDLIVAAIPDVARKRGT